MMNRPTFLWGLFSTLLFFSCQAREEENKATTATVITEVNIIDVNDGSIQKGHVVIDSGVIQQILPLNADHDWEKATQINGKGKYLLPGLAEMHAHIPPVVWNDPLMEETLFLYLSNGVTTIRGMLGHQLHLELREKAANMEILTPRIFTSSPSLNGNSVTTPEMAQKIVKAYKEEGYDFLKLHPGIRLHVFDEIVKTASSVGIPFAGHVSNLVGIHHALRSGYASIDHVDGFLEGLVPESENVNPTENGFFGYNFTYLADTTLIGELVGMAKVHQVWVVPTQTLFTRWFSPASAEVLAQEEEMKYMPLETLNNWVNSKENLTGSEDYEEEKWQKFMEIRNKLLVSLQKDGHGLLLGSDAPQVFNVPGFSIKHEMEAMVEAGLSPLEVIQSGTINPALYFEKKGAFGEIKEGASADLILLDKNPLVNISNMRQQSGVMVKGEWMDQKEIDEKLQAIADKYKQQKQKK